MFLSSLEYPLHGIGSADKSRRLQPPGLALDRGPVEFDHDARGLRNARGVGSGSIRQIHHGDEHKYIENVDVNIINNVARDLPLSREKRPQWDINLLLEMGVKGLETEVDRSRFEDEHGKDHQVIDHFMIYAVK